MDDKLLGDIRELNYITLALRLHYNKHKTVCILCIGTEPDCPSIGDSEANDTIFENSEHSSNELCVCQIATLEMSMMERFGKHSIRLNTNTKFDPGRINPRTERA